MNHPLVDNLQDLTDAELQTRISDLSTKYWQTSNPSVHAQMGLILDQLKEEFRLRSSKNNNNDEQKDLDNLINIS